MVLANLVTVVVGEEHVGRKTALGLVGVWRRSQHKKNNTAGRRDDDDENNVKYTPFFLRPPSALEPRLARVVVFSLGMVASFAEDWLKRATRRQHCVSGGGTRPRRSYQFDRSGVVVVLRSMRVGWRADVWAAGCACCCDRHSQAARDAQRHK